MSFADIITIELSGTRAWIGRTGYTGEKGYEIFLAPNVACTTWQEILDKNADLAIAPVGLGARDTLRLEACYLLYGNDIDDTITPLEAGIGWATKHKEKDFIGKSSMLQKELSSSKRRVFAFKLEEPGIPRKGMSILQNDRVVGRVSSGSFLPTLNVGGGMALLEVNGLQTEEPIWVDIRGKKKLALLSNRPLYKARVKD